MHSQTRKFLIIPITAILIEIIIFISSSNWLDQMGVSNQQNLVENSVFWNIQLENNTIISVSPTIITTLLWFGIPIAIAVFLSIYLQLNRENISREGYIQALLIQGLITLIFLELTAVNYAWIISSLLDKAFIEAFMASNLYFILPIMVIWSFITESFEPRIVLPLGEARLLTGVFVAMLFFVYTITMSIGTVS